MKLPKEKFMNKHNKNRLYQLMLKSRTGLLMSDSDMDFTYEMLKDHPQEYRDLHKSAVKETAKSINPFIEDADIK